MTLPNVLRKRENLICIAFQHENEIVKQIEQGLTDTEIAAMFRVRPSDVSTIRCKGHLANPHVASHNNKPWSPASDALLLHERDKRGQPWSALAARFDRPTSEIILRYDYLKRLEARRENTAPGKQAMRRCLGYGPTHFFKSDHPGHRRCDACRRAAEGLTDAYDLVLPTRTL